MLGNYLISLAYSDYNFIQRVLVPKLGNFVVFVIIQTYQVKIKIAYLYAITSFLE